MKQTRTFYYISAVACFIFIPVPLIPIIITGFVFLCKSPENQIERVRSKNFICCFSAKGFICFAYIVFLLSVGLCIGIQIWIFLEISPEIYISLSVRQFFMDLNCIYNLVKYIRLLKTIAKYSISKEDLAQRIANTKYQFCWCWCTC